MPVYTPFVNGEPGNATTFNARFDELAASISTGGGVVSRIVPTTTLVSSTASINISSIPSTYSVLQLLMLVRANVGAASTSLSITVNNDATAANYYLRRISTTSSSSTDEVLGTDANWTINNAVLGATALANHFAVIEITFLLYNLTAIAKAMMYRGYAHSADSVAGMRIVTGGGSWRGNQALDSIQLTTPGQFVADTSYTLYGYL